MDTLKAKLRLIAACASLAAAILLSGCGSVSVEEQATSGEVVLDIPETNPYKADITQRFNETKSPFARKVLADGVVTDAELAEGEARYKVCLEKVGLKATIAKIPTGSSIEIEPIDGVADYFDEREEKIAECDSSSGYYEIEGTYGSLKGNPDNKNPVEMMLKCLKKRGVVEAGLTLKEFDPMYEDGEYMDAHREEFAACYADPNFYNQ